MTTIVSCFIKDVNTIKYRNTDKDTLDYMLLMNYLRINVEKK